MPYLNLDLDYFAHPKTIRLIGLLGKGAADLPIRLWCKVGKYHPRDGRLTGYTEEAIEAHVNWWGKPGEGVDGMVKAGFLQKTEDGYTVVDWKDHQGHLWALKVRNKKVAQNRWKNIEKCTSTVDTSGTPKSTSGVPQSVHSVPPRKEDVCTYCGERGKGMDGAHFWDYWSARGWMMGKTKMKDWKAAVRTWEKNDYRNARSQRVVGAAKPEPGKYDALTERMADKAAGGTP